jgi:hypothetical protein
MYLKVFLIIVGLLALDLLKVELRHPDALPGSRT